MAKTTLVLFISCLFGFIALSYCGDLGNGQFHHLPATKDVWLEGSSNKNYYNFLIVGKHPGYSKKRFLIQFQDLPQCSRVQWAKMYLNFWYAHKASWQSVQSAPYIPRSLQVHQVKKYWSESQATTYYRWGTTRWNSPYAALDGSDAARYTQDVVTIFTGRPGGWVEFDVTEAVRNWKAGNPNYGLLVWATNENRDGRDLRFYSREKSGSEPFITVLCDY